MLPLETLGSTTTADGQQLVLYHRDGVFMIRVDGLELMSSRAHGSETSLARLAFENLPTAKGARPRVLIGGLGMGYTLRAALDLLPPRAQVVVAEVFDCVVEWNRGPLAELAHRPLDDGRVELRVRDVFEVLAEREAFDVILLDVDNGPNAFTLAANDRLYSPRGLERLHGAVKPEGVLAVWSSDDDRGFVRRLGKAGFRVTTRTVSARGPGVRSEKHTIFLGRKGVSGRPPRGRRRSRTKR